MPTRGFGLTKRALQRGASRNDLDAQLALEEELQREAGRTADYAEGVRAFLEKRKPVFEGALMTEPTRASMRRRRGRRRDGQRHRAGGGRRAAIAWCSATRSRRRRARARGHREGASRGTWRRAA